MVDAACYGNGADPADIVDSRLVVRPRPSDYDTVILWLRTPFTTVLMVLLLIALFYHMALGLQVVVEDYVHTERMKMPAVVVIHLGCFALAVAGIRRKGATRA